MTACRSLLFSLWCWCSCWRCAAPVQQVAAAPLSTGSRKPGTQLLCTCKTGAKVLLPSSFDLWCNSIVEAMSTHGWTRAEVLLNKLDNETGAVLLLNYIVRLRIKINSNQRYTGFSLKTDFFSTFATPPPSPTLGGCYWLYRKCSRSDYALRIASMIGCSPKHMQWWVAVNWERKHNI